MSINAKSTLGCLSPTPTSKNWEKKHCSGLINTNLVFTSEWKIHEMILGKHSNTIDIDHVRQEQHPTYRSDCIFIFNLQHLFGSYNFFTILTPKGLTNPICIDGWLHMMDPIW